MILVFNCGVVTELFSVKVQAQGGCSKPARLPYND